MNTLNRPLFQRYARQPMMQQPMMQQPVGIMASSPELMQASMGYNQGGSVQSPASSLGYYVVDVQGNIIKDTRPTTSREQVDITQEPIEFQETVTETVGGFTEEGLAQEVEKYSDPFLNPDVPSEPKPEASDADTLSKAEQLGAQAVDNGELNPDTAPAPLAAAVNTLNDPDKTPTEEADAILAGMGKNAPKGTKGKIGAMKDLIRDTFGVDASRYDNLKALNRAAVGFAIAKGDDIAAALERGAQGAAAIEEKSLARDDSMSQMALQQVFAEKLAGMRNAAAMAGKASDYTPERLRQRAIEAILRSPDQFNVYNDKTGAVDPAKVQREANILVTAMMQQSPSTDMPATGSDPVPTMTHKEANNAAKEKGEPFYTLDGKKFKVQ